MPPLNILHTSKLVSVLVLGIGIASGQYYWILDIGWVAWYRSNRNRVRTILVLGYWVLGSIHRYWIVLLLGNIFCCSDTQYNTNQTTVSTVHMPVNDYLVPLLTCTLTDAIVCLDGGAEFARN